MRTPTRFKKNPLSIAVRAACYSMLGALPLAQATTGGVVVGGNGSINQSGTNTTINQATQNLAINWQTFNVAANERVQFIQPNVTSVALNRVIGNNGSSIAGRIDANGRVILVNPNGVFFSSTAVLNVGSIIASGLDINPADFMKGQYIFNEIGGTSGKVVNSGLINASLGGNVALVGKQVKNDGVITANLGTVTLAAGKQAVLTFDNAGLLGVRVSQEILQSELGVDPAVINSGEIQAQGGRVLLTASQSQDVFSRAVNTTGMEPATSVVVHPDGTFTLGGGADVVNSGSIDTSSTGMNQNGGRIVVLGNNVVSSGTLKADAVNGNGGEIELHSSNMTLLIQNSVTSARAESDGRGGTVKVLGDKVGLFDQSAVDVSGANGGGQALIGGDFQGKNAAIHNATTTIVDRDAKIIADALKNGDGGKVILWADGTTRFLGSIFTRGGALSGNGGFVETSGKKYLQFDGIADRTAANGRSGLLLLDPETIYISTSIQSGTTPVSSVPPVGNPAVYTIAYADSFSDGNQDTDPNLITISPATLQTALGSGSVLLQATNDIFVNSDVTTTSASNLTLEARDDISINAVITMGGGDLTLRANSDNSAGVGAGNVTVIRNINTNGGNLNIYGVNFSGASTSASSADAVTINTGTAGDATINMTGDVLLGGMAVGGNLSVTAGTGAGTGITQGQNNTTNDILSVTGTSTFTSSRADRDITLSNNNDLRGAISLTTTGAYQADASLTNTSATTTLANASVAGNLTVDAAQNLTVTGTVEGLGTDGGGSTRITTLALNFGTGGSDSTFTATGATIREGAAVSDVVSNDSVNINITGGNGNNTFNINNATIATINGALNTNRGITIGGGAGIDTFNIAANINGLISGGAGDDRFNINASGIAIFSVEGNAGTNTLASGVATANSWLLNNTDSGTLTNGGSAVDFTGIANLTGGSGQDNFIIDNANGTLSGLMDGGGGGTDTLTISNNTTNSNNRIIQLGSAVNAAANLTVDRVETITANSGTTANNTLIAPDTTSNVWAIGATEATNTVSDGVTTTTFSNFANARGGNHTVTGSEQFTVNAVTTQQIGVNSVTNINTGNGTTDVTVSALANVSGTIITGTGTNTVAIRGVVGAIDGTANNGNNTVAVYAGGSVTNAINTGSGIDTITVGEASVSAPATTVGSINVGDGTNNNVVVHAGASVAGAINGGAGADTVTVDGSAGSIATLGGDDTITIAAPSVITSTAANAIDGGDGTGDSLAVNSVGNTWSLTSNTSGTVSNAGTTRGFVNVEGFVDNGSGGNATLDYSSILGSVSVNLGLIGGFSNIIGNNDGGTAVPAGNDSTLLGTNFRTTWTINGTNSGEVSWIGHPTAITFSRFNNLTGGTGTDDFNFRVHPTAFTTGSITGLVRGGGGLGVNTISGLNAANFWSITAANTGNLNAGTTDTATNYASFQEINGLNGGDAGDIFSFSVPVTGSVTINGDGTGVQVGVDSVNLALLTGSSVAVQLGSAGFSNIEQFTGNGTNSTLTGADIANAWTITGVNAGCVGGTGQTCVGGTSFTGFTALVGALNQNDTFNFNVTPLVAAVTVDGRGHTTADTVSFATLTGQAVSVQLGAAGFNGIEGFTGNGTNSTLTGADIANAWTITGANAGCVGGTGPTCVGGTSFTGFTALVGALNQNDTFNFNVTPLVAAVTVDGRGHTTAGGAVGDTVSFASLTGQAVSVQLGAAGFNGIEGFTGNNTDSTLLAGNGTNNWFLTGTNDGSVNGITFTNFNKLVGGTGNDTFDLNTNGQLTGFIDGGGSTGTNTLNINASADTIIRLVDTQPTGSIANPAGTFTVYQVGFLNGNSANNHTLALDVSNTQTTSVAWGIGTENAGTVNFGTIATFTGFRNLTGSAVNDTFTLTSGSVQELVTGLINGGGQTVGGEDVLILTGMTGGAAGVDVRLGSTATAGELNVDGIERIAGNGNAASILTADNGTNDWSITGANDGSVRLNVGAANQYDVAFTDFNVLRGGDGNDNFRILFNGTLSASIAGGGQVANTQGDTVDYSAQTTVAVNFGTGAFNGIDQIESVRGNGTNSTLNGPTSGNPNWAVTGINTGSVTDGFGFTLGFQGFNYLVGGAGNDTFVITNGSLRNVVTNVPGLIRGGGGTNIVNVNLTGVGTSSGQINYQGSGTDTINFNPTTSVGYEASYTPVVTITDPGNAPNSGTYEQLSYSYTDGGAVNTSLTLNYQNVDTVISQLAVNTLTVNGSSTSGTTRLGAGTFTVGTRTQVAYSGVSNVTAAGQSAVELNGTNITGTLTLANTGPITGSGLTAGTLVLDTTGSFGAAGTPINTSIDNLRLINAGPVYIAESNDLSLFTTGTVVNAGSFVIVGTTNIDAGGGSLTLDNAANDFDTLNVTNAASVNLRDVDRIDGGTMTAASIILNTASGVGTSAAAPLTTSTSNLTINNGTGGVYVNNNGATTARITTLGDIGLTNNGNLTIDRLYSGGSGFLDRGLYRDVTLNVTNGSVQGMQANSIYAAPDITALNLTAIVQGGGGFGNPGRPMSISVIDTFTYIGGRGYVHYFGGRPSQVIGVADLVVFSGLDTLSSLRLLEIESLDEFDPAIFTEVRNYYYEDVAILMPTDQRLDASDEEEKEKEKEEKL